MRAKAGGRIASGNGSRWAFNLSWGAAPIYRRWGGAIERREAVKRRGGVKMANAPHIGNGKADGLIALRAQQKAARANG